MEEGAWDSRKRIVFGVRRPKLEPCLSLTSGVTLDKSLNISEPQLIIAVIPASWVVVGIK